jgi:hypothetical protein
MDMYVGDNFFLDYDKCNIGVFDETDNNDWLKDIKIKEYNKELFLKTFYERYVIYKGHEDTEGKKDYELLKKELDNMINKEKNLEISRKVPKGEVKITLLPIYDFLSSAELEKKEKNKELTQTDKFCINISEIGKFTSKGIIMFILCDTYYDFYEDIKHKYPFIPKLTKKFKEDIIFIPIIYPFDIIVDDDNLIQNLIKHHIDIIKLILDRIDNEYIIYLAFPEETCFFTIFNKVLKEKINFVKLQFLKNDYEFNLNTLEVILEIPKGSINDIENLHNDTLQDFNIRYKNDNKKLQENITKLNERIKEIRKNKEDYDRYLNEENIEKEFNIN